MKIILAIIQDKDSNRLSNELIDANIRATKLSSTGVMQISVPQNYHRQAASLRLETARLSWVLKMIE